MHFDYLSKFGVFAVNCQVLPDKVTVGLLVLDGDLDTPDEMELFADNGTSYFVKLPDELPDEPFDLELERI